MPGGHLILHLVDRSKFDPILPVADVFGGVDPQKYSKKRITSTVASFDTHDYKANFKLDGDNGIFSISLTSQQTSRLIEGKYVYDVVMSDIKGATSNVVNGLAFVDIAMTGYDGGGAGGASGPTDGVTLDGGTAY